MILTKKMSTTYTPIIVAKNNYSTDNYFKNKSLTGINILVRCIRFQRESNCGELAERFNALVLKTSVGL
jgi:hypothetical protein